MQPVERTVVAASYDVLAGGPVVVLSAAEQERWARLEQQVDRDAFVAARLLARVLAGQVLGVAPEDVAFTQVCEDCGGPHGRPRVVGHDLHVGWSHSDGLVAATVDAAPCAVDVQVVAPLRGGAPPLGVLGAAERAWLAGQADEPAALATLWVRKEVLVKLGDTTLDALPTVDVLPSLTGQPVLGRVLATVDVGDLDAVAARASAP